MYDALVRVRPMGAAWLVDGGEGLEPLLFLFGAKAEAQAQLTTKAPMAEHDGDAMMTIKGGVVMIN